MVEIPYNTLRTVVDLANTLASFKDLSRRQEMHLSAAEALLDHQRKEQTVVEKNTEESESFGTW